MRGCSVEGVDFVGAQAIEKMNAEEVNFGEAKLGADQRLALGLEDLDSEFANLQEIDLR